MSSGFPQRANLNENIYKTILSRAGNNKKVSEKLPWIKVTSCLHEFLSLESTPMNDSFASRYGGKKDGRSGRIGINQKGDPVYPEKINDIDGNEIGIDRSFRSSPIIESVVISQGKEGLSKKTNFTIKAFTLAQADALVQYFLEPGGNVLVEWGFNESNSVIYKSAIDACEIAKYQNIKHLTDKRKKSLGTYDAVLGIITGGSMSFGEAESYNIEVEITSIGEIPAYLQHHKNVRNGEEEINNTGETFAISDIDSDAEERKSVGTSLFKQMYNDLPSHKQTSTIKNLAKESWATDEGNFVNMDKEIREKLIEATKNADLRSEDKDGDGDDLSIPTDTPLFDTDRYIKASLAFTILDLTHTLTLKPIRVGCDENVQTSNPYINWRNTIIRAHKNIFSTDGSKLMIPNEKTPDFDLNSALTSKKEPNPTITFSSGQGSRSTIVTQPNGTYPENTFSPTMPFPRKTSIEYSAAKDIDSDYECIEYNRYEWGYLKDLYINFDFFISCISSPGLLSKDVYYKILNGLSGAVNMNWDFQLTESPWVEPQDSSDGCIKWWRKRITNNLDKGATELKVVCFNTTGNTTNKLGKAKFQSRGINSPFLSAEINMDIPSAMKGQVVMQKNASRDASPNTEQKDKDFRGLFTKYKDALNEKLNSFRKKEDAEREAEQKAAEQREEDKLTSSEKAKKERKEKKAAEKAKEAQKKSNYETFAKKATVVPRAQFRAGDIDVAKAWFSGLGGDANIEDIMMVVAFSDTELLKNVEVFNKGIIDGKFQEENQKSKDAIALPVKFNFTIHGVSGIKVGDTFNIPDLPGVYKKKIFTVTQIEHNIEQTIWKTSVQASLVSIDASKISYEQKYKKPKSHQQI